MCNQYGMPWNFDMMDMLCNINCKLLTHNNMQASDEFKCNKIIKKTKKI